MASRMMKKGVAALLAASLILTPAMAAQAGWQQADGRWRYANPAGQGLAVGLQYIDEKYYYFSQDGTMQTGWVKDGRNYHYMQADGSMLLDARTPDGYYVDTCGNWVKEVGRLPAGEKEITRVQAIGKVEALFPEESYSYLCNHFVNDHGTYFYVVEVKDGDEAVSTYLASSDGMILQEGYYYVGDDGTEVVGFY